MPVMNPSRNTMHASLPSNPDNAASAQKVAVPMLRAQTS